MILTATILLPVVLVLAAWGLSVRMWRLHGHLTEIHDAIRVRTSMAHEVMNHELRDQAIRLDPWIGPFFPLQTVLDSRQEDEHHG